MKTSIFNFLGEFSSTLENIALRVEDLLWDYPQEALAKARVFGETLVNMIFEQEDLHEVYPLNQWEKIKKLYKQDIIQDEIYTKFEYIRKHGNVAAHEPKEMDLELAKEAHHVLFDLSVWYMEVYVSHEFDAPPYELPAKQVQDSLLVKEWMEAYQKRIAEIELQLEQLKLEKKEQPISVKEEKKTIAQSQMKNRERIVPLERFQATFEQANFEWKNTSKKAAEFILKGFDEEDREAYVYLLDNVTPTIAFHPSLIDQVKVLIDVTDKPLKNTALRKFPKMVENNVAKSNFGFPFTFQTKAELEMLLAQISEVLRNRN